MRLRSKFSLNAKVECEHECRILVIRMTWPELTDWFGTSRGNISDIKSMRSTLA